jgi:hypothetical protein
MYSRNWNSLFGIAADYGLDVRGSIPGRVKIFLFSTASRRSPAPTKPPTQLTREALSPGVKRPGRKAGHSLLSSAEVKNTVAIPALPNTSAWRGA